jgi:hypothetical protein
MFSLNKLNRNTLRLDVSMKDPVFMHVVNGLEDLIHEELDPILWQVMSAPLYRLVHVHVHELKHQSEAASGLITTSSLLKMKSLLEHFMKRDDVWMW